MAHELGNKKKARLRKARRLLIVPFKTKLFGSSVHPRPGYSGAVYGNHHGSTQHMAVPSADLCPDMLS